MLRAYKDIYAQRDSSDGLIYGTMKKAAIRHDCCGCIGNRSTNGYGEGYSSCYSLSPVISAGNRGVSADTELLIGGLFQMVA